MPQGVAVLEELGLLPELLARGGAVFHGIRYRSRRGTWAEADFPPCQDSPDFGVAMPRFELDHLILQRAKAFTNVTVREGFQVARVLQEGSVVRGVEGHSGERPDDRESFSAPLTIATDGPNSIFHRACGLTKTYLPRQRFGVTGHVKGLQGIDPYVEVLLQPQGEIYVAPCGDGLSLVALLLEKEAMTSFRGDLRERYLSFLRSAPGLGERMSGAELVGPVLTAGPLGFTVEPCYGPGLLLIGDSAGFLDPITGEGMTLALKCVQAAAPLVEEAFATETFGADLFSRYAEQRARLVEDLFRLTQLILAASQHVFLTNRAIRRLSHDRELFRKFLGVVTGGNRYSEISLRDKCALLLG